MWSYMSEGPWRTEEEQRFYHLRCWWCVSERKTHVCAYTLYSIGINDLPSFFFSCHIAYAFDFGVLSLIRVKSPHHTGPSDIPHFPALIPDFTPRCLIGSKDPHHTSKPTHASTDKKIIRKTPQQTQLEQCLCVQYTLHNPRHGRGRRRSRWSRTVEEAWGASWPSRKKTHWGLMIV